MNAEKLKLFINSDYDLFISKINKYNKRNISNKKKYDILDMVIKTEDSDIIYAALKQLKWLTSSQKDILIDEMVNLNNYWIMCYCANTIDISKESINNISKAIIKAKDPNYAYILLSHNNEMSKKYKEELFNLIVNSKDVSSIVKTAYLMVNDKNKFMILVDKLIDLNETYEMIPLLSFNHDVFILLQDKIEKTNDNYLILNYVVKMCRNDLLIKRYNSLENAILIVNNLKIETSKKEELIKRLKDLNVINNKLKYVDLSQEMELKLEKKSLYKNKRLL